ncbi:LacI family DNA-binding transcriptional regulator [Pseudoroseomonas globiformis]|uniref:LacI family DNA-binding transcriptional regulator n=1 Tax=Teichococcus globiformis TaxID=2307229 RepID=A0ABV7G5F1_9PROT
MSAKPYFERHLEIKVKELEPDHADDCTLKRKPRDFPRVSGARPTVSSLARLAGVASSTVSRALKGDERISPAVRRRIAALAAEAGYTPNALARGLVGGRSGLVGLVLGPVSNPIYAEMMQEAVTEAERRGLRLMLLHAGPGPIEDSTAAALLQYRMDGCLITSAGLSSRAAAICAANDVPVVMLNRVPKLHAVAVSCDNRAGGEALALHLLETGHRRPAIIMGNADTSTSLERAEAFATALVEAGLEPPRRFPGGASHAAGFAAGQAIAGLPARERPDAIFGCADILAMGAMDALREAGLRVPEDISVVGFDGIAAAAAAPYRMTTLSVPLSAMIARGFGLLAERMSGIPLPDEVVLLRGTLQRRGTVRDTQPPG